MGAECGVEGEEVGVAFGENVGSEWEAEGDVVECVRFFVWSVGKVGAGDGDFERRCHVSWVVFWSAGGGDAR